MANPAKICSSWWNMLAREKCRTSQDTLRCQVVNHPRGCPILFCKRKDTGNTWREWMESIPSDCNGYWPIPESKSGTMAAKVTMTSCRVFRLVLHWLLINVNNFAMKWKRYHILRVVWILTRLGPQDFRTIARQLELRCNGMPKLDSSLPTTASMVVDYDLICRGRTLGQ